MALSAATAELPLACGVLSSPGGGGPMHLIARGRKGAQRALIGAALAVVLAGGCSGGSGREPAAAGLELREGAADVVRVPGDDALIAPNPGGVGRTLTATGSIDTTSLFYRSIGANGRACVSCHVASQGWTVTPAGVRERFERTQGLDPIFRANDGSSSPLADLGSLAARRRAFSMLLTKGLIRVGIGIPDGAEFEL